MPEFFGSAGPERPALTLFLNAGDPPLPELHDLVFMLDEEGVDCLELAVPFPDSVTDGPVVRESARRALARGVGVEDVLTVVAQVRPRLRQLRIAVLADWGHTMRPRGIAAMVAAVADSGADALLAHALPPRLSEEYYRRTTAAGLPVVSTCYAQSTPATMAAAAGRATAFLYLVARYGRSGTSPTVGYSSLAETIAHLKTLTSAPVAVGFGVRTRQDVWSVAAAGADAAVIGSAGVTHIARSQEKGGDVVADFRDFVRSCSPSPDHWSAP
ncbi:tryptophan synthase subunit alpha [Lipingzhangella sp. LS1_29]|uniref:tryptophan synthase n=1 Tax=Lipingzhangella rawalii TaxID=2055835 RepID=A0ABU2HCD3_9ACTN|nr:tryptophan synthase subunit alpha [Lipingzhangella rawalii]MDS1272465.1 tryptophan synthase subunit alpha [Lipingzhangella rawalii]